MRHRGREPVDVPWEDVERLAEGAVRLRRAPSAGRRDGGLLHLARDVLDAQIVDVAGRRVVRVGDVELAGDEALRVVAVDVGAASVLRRLGLRRLARRARRDAVDWRDLHLASGRGHGLVLRTAVSGLQRLDPPALAKVVAHLPVDRGADVLEAVGHETAAAALSASRPSLSGPLVGAIEPEIAGRIVAAMPADDATAALRHLGDARLERLLSDVPSNRAGVLRRLLAYPPDTAGGLMSPDVRTARDGEPLEAIRARLASEPVRLEGLATVFVLDAGGAVIGAIAPSALLGADVQPVPVPTVAIDTPVDEVVDLFAVHDLLAMPVLDDQGQLVGAVAVDDVLEELLVERLPGRRRFRHRFGRRRHGPS